MCVCVCVCVCVYALYDRVTDSGGTAQREHRSLVRIENGIESVEGECQTGRCTGANLEQNGSTGRLMRNVRSNAVIRVRSERAETPVGSAEKQATESPFGCRITDRSEAVALLGRNTLSFRCPRSYESKMGLRFRHAFSSRGFEIRDVCL